MNEKYIAICEKLDWTIREYPNGDVELEKYSPAGEDFIFTASAKNFVKDAKEYAASFDIDEHIEKWTEAKIHNTTSGVPSIRRLVIDAEVIDEMLQELTAALAEVEGEYDTD